MPSSPMSHEYDVCSALSSRLPRASALSCILSPCGRRSWCASRRTHSREECPNIEVVFV